MCPGILHRFGFLQGGAKTLPHSHGHPVSIHADHDAVGPHDSGNFKVHLQPSEDVSKQMD